jgi:RNA polymerase sigma-70 factor (ECF subfamily)
VVDDRREDAELIAASLTDPAQFELIFERHYGAIHRYLARRGGWELAEDLTQSVFLAGFAGRRRFRPSEASAAPWLFGIATNLLRRHARTELRRLRAYARLPAREVAPFDVDVLVDRLDAATLAPRAFDVVSRLPEGERSALLLVAWTDLTYEQVAVALNVPVGTIRSRIHRARGKLRELLGANGQDRDMNARAVEPTNDG